MNSAMKCFWCNKTIDQAKIGHCLIHTDTLLTACVPGDPQTKYVLRSELGVKKYGNAPRKFEK
jgi:hypothetical protein